ncbi:hypothetical protein [Chitinimonas taiwanensis]|nr:hypothetical protein [Chitinimonas taiwanensis]
MQKRWLLLVPVLFVAHIAANFALLKAPHTSTALEMQVALPRFVQVAMSGGDRYLAANLASFRALLVSTERMQADNFAIQGKVQRDAAWLNPAHEDNYYIAAAILPWNDELDAGQYVLKQAITARKFDWQPIFYYAFNIYHFEGNPAKAAVELLNARSVVTSENDRMAIENIAARWLEKGFEPKAAMQVVDIMARQAKPGQFKEYLKTRVDRLRVLLSLQEAAAMYISKKGRPAKNFEELRAAGLISVLPVDPFGFGYVMNQAGEPVLLNSAPKVKK